MTRGAALGLGALFVFIALAPFLPRLFAGLPLLGAAGTALDAWFRFQCERDPLRTWPAAAVCVRCLGIYAGFGFGGALGRPALPLGALKAWMGAAALLIVLDVLSESLGWRGESAPVRVLSGFLLAYPVGLLVAGALRART